MKSENLTIFDIADWFLIHEPMTHKKLQKLLYFSYGYYLATYNTNVEKLCNEMFTNDFEAWVHGPVSPKIYNTYRSAGYSLIMKNTTAPIVLSDEVEKVLYFVLEKYKFYDGDQLERITHNQTPWLNARNGLSAIEPCSNPILSKDIYNFFVDNKLIID